VGVFIDLKKKAFDTIDHRLFITKLEKDGVVLDWMKSYIRLQFVQIGECRSDFVGITCGVPQGSILGPK